jgi:hypothetical protein
VPGRCREMCGHRHATRQARPARPDCSGRGGGGSAGGSQDRRGVDSGRVGRNWRRCCWRQTGHLDRNGYALTTCQPRRPPRCVRVPDRPMAPRCRHRPTLRDARVRQSTWTP